MDKERLARFFGRGRSVEASPSKPPTVKKAPEKRPAGRSKVTAEKKSTSRKPEVKRGKPTQVEKSKPPVIDIATKTNIKKDRVPTEKKDRKISKKTKVIASGTATVVLGTVGAIFALKGNIFDNNNGSDGSSTTTTSQPLAGANDGTSTTTSIADTTTTAAATTTTTEGQPEGFQVSLEADAFLAAWPKTPEEAAQRFGGYPSQWALNPEWIGKTIDNVNLGIFGFPNIEWRPVDLRNLPFDWPKTAEEAVEYFFPGQKIDPISMQPSWLIDPDTGEPTENIENGVAIGWHLDEDHALHDESETNVPVTLHPGETAEGYFVNNTLIAIDDRNFVLYGGFIGQEPPDFSDVRGQGWTVWMRGVNPDAVALRMTLFDGPNNNVPHYSGPDGQQLGPDAYGFPPAYPAPAKENNR